MNNKKISFLFTNLDCGGIERVLITLLNNLAKKNYKINLLLLQKKGMFLKELLPSINVIDLNCKKAIFSTLKILKYLNQNNDHVLVSAVFNHNIITLLAKSFSKTKTKIIISEHSNLSNDIKEVAKYKYLIIKFLIKKLYPRANSIICVSQGVASDLISNLKIKSNNIRVIYNPFNINEITIKAQKPINHPWLINKSKPIILGVGRFVNAKDFPNLIKAFYELRRKIDANLIILGDGEKRSELEKLVKKLNLKEYVDLPGFVNNPHTYMNKSDIFVLSSKYEGFGNVIVEALASGTQVVSTDCPSGPAEILKNGKYGRLVPVNNPKLLANAILESLNNPINPLVLQNRANDFSEDKIVNQYLKTIFK